MPVWPSIVTLALPSPPPPRPASRPPAAHRPPPAIVSAGYGSALCRDKSSPSWEFCAWDKSEAVVGLDRCFASFVESGKCSECGRVCGVRDQSLLYGARFFLSLLHFFLKVM